MFRSNRLSTHILKLDDLDGVPRRLVLLRNDLNTDNSLLFALLAELEYSLVEIPIDIVHRIAESGDMWSLSWWDASTLSREVRFHELFRGFQVGDPFESDLFTWVLGDEGCGDLARYQHV